MLNLSIMDPKSFLFMDSEILSLDVNQPKESLNNYSLSSILVKYPKEYTKLLDQNLNIDKDEVAMILLSKLTKKTREISDILTREIIDDYSYMIFMDKGFRNFPKKLWKRKVKDMQMEANSKSLILNCLFNDDKSRH